MPSGIVIILFVLSLGAWFLLGEKRSVKDKIELIFVLIFVYIFSMVALGARTPKEVFAPILQILNIGSS